MGKITKTIEDYQCDNCKVLDSNRTDHIWFGWIVGRNVPSYLSPNMLFCTETCAESWLLKATSWLRELTTNDLKEKFRTFKANCDHPKHPFDGGDCDDR